MVHLTVCRQTVDVVRAAILEGPIRGGPYQKCRNSRHGQDARATAGRMPRHYLSSDTGAST